jgi:thiol:disulfide interchange protein
MTRSQTQKGNFAFIISLLIFLLLSFLYLSCSKSSQTYSTSSGIEWETDYQTALQKASQSSKPIVLDLYTDWCYWCKRLDEDVWADSAMIAFSEGQVYLKLDAEHSEDGRILVEKFKLRGYPTVVILNHRGEEINKIVGYLPADKYLQKLKDILAVQ